jgi:hypothetical protein
VRKPLLALEVGVEAAKERRDRRSQPIDHCHFIVCEQFHRVASSHNITLALACWRKQI